MWVGLWGSIGDFEEKTFSSHKEGKLKLALEVLAPTLQEHLENQPLPQMVLVVGVPGPNGRDYGASGPPIQALSI